MREHLKHAVIAGAVAVPLAAAVAVPASAARSGGGDDGGPGASSAYGIAADGLIAIPPTPAVTSEHPPFTRSVVSIPGDPLVHASVLRTRAVPGHAGADVVDLKVAKAGIRPDAVLTAKLIS